MGLSVFGLVMLEGLAVLEDLAVRGHVVVIPSEPALGVPLVTWKAFKALFSPFSNLAIRRRGAIP